MNGQMFKLKQDLCKMIFIFIFIHICALTLSFSPSHFSVLIKKGEKIITKLDKLDDLVH